MNNIKDITNFIFLEHKPKKSDLIIILGTKRKYLCQKATNLFSKKYAPYILTTGGKIVEEEKECFRLKNILIEEGVDKDRIYTEDKSLNTKENAIYAKEVVERDNIKHDKIIIVCKSFHARRAYMTFKNVFTTSEIYMVPSGSDEDVSKDSWYKDKEEIDLVMSEVRKIGEYYTKGDLSI